MMEDLAMQILELLMNSIHAGASHIYLTITESVKENLIQVHLEDDGKGMSEEFVAKVTDPFTTTRKTRKVGMGVAFFKGLTDMCNGRFEINSRPGTGTLITAELQRDWIDTPPLGNIGEMMMYCIQADENISYVLKYSNDKSDFIFQSDEVKAMLDGVSLLEPEILLWVKDYINEGIEHVKEDLQ
ncbi:MAG: ATP-binding protein [Solobacterium sp.]|jgi:anti-sigma regulatory factor (Ser/Thr protein kinase)|nr:ATP-binding protein [Solobacterium sp.]HAE17559.1 ATP-binding protein [Erysipelotrichaceae bacterium]